MFLCNVLMLVSSFADPQIAEVINDLVADENKSAAKTGITLFIITLMHNTLSQYRGRLKSP